MGSGRERWDVVGRRCDEDAVGVWRAAVEKG